MNPRMTNKLLYCFITLIFFTSSCQKKVADNHNIEKPPSGVDTSDKFPRIADTALLTKIQAASFGYFYDFAQPFSGMARERNSSADLVTTGGTGFGIMAILVGIKRGFISRSQGLDQIIKIIDFLL